MMPKEKFPLENQLQTLCLILSLKHHRLTKQNLKSSPNLSRLASKYKEVSPNKVFTKNSEPLPPA